MCVTDECRRRCRELPAGSGRCLWCLWRPAQRQPARLHHHAARRDARLAGADLRGACGRRHDNGPARTRAARPSRPQAPQGPPPRPQVTSDRKELPVQATDLVRVFEFCWLHRRRYRQPADTYRPPRLTICCCPVMSSVYVSWRQACDIQSVQTILQLLDTLCITLETAQIVTSENCLHPAAAERPR